MGQQGESNDVGLANAGVFHDFQTHTSHDRVSTTDAIVRSLRERYPDYTITLTPDDTGIISYANAGQAEAKLDTTEGTFLRVHKVAKGRSTEEPGSTNDKVNFGRYDYLWEDKVFIVYTVEYCENYFRTEQITFILHKKDKKDIVDGRSSATEELIAAASQYSSEPHDEVFVFDQEVWTKNTELWSAVQQSSWDDVILESEMKESLIKDVEGFFDFEHEYKEFAVPWKVSAIAFL